jgi:hypothetical protein
LPLGFSGVGKRPMAESKGRAMDGERPSAFRGVAGEVVRGFVQLGTLATVLVVMLVMLLVALGAVLLVKVTGLPAPFAGLLLMVSSSPIIGRFAMAAREGQLDAGFLNADSEKGAVIGFMFRHVTLCIGCGIPLGIAASVMLKSASASGGVFGGGLMPSGGAAVGLMVLGVVGGAAQILSLLIATKTDSVSEAISADAWRWVLVHRRPDLFPFLASLVGGMVVFAMLIWPVCGILSMLVMRQSVSAGAVLASFTYAAPILAGPILLGRMCGAFVFGEAPMGSPVPAPAAVLPPLRAAQPSVSRTPVASVAVGAPQPRPPGLAPPVSRTPPPEPASAATAAARRMDVNQALDVLMVKAGADPPAAVKEAQILRDAYPANPRVAVALARLLQQTGQKTESIAAAAHAIRTALTAGTAPLAIEMWGVISESRGELELDPIILEALGKQLVTRKNLKDAAWCFQAMLRRGGDPLRVQKGLISVAEATAREGNAIAAAQIYRLLLKEFPESTLREFMENAIVQLEPR